MRTEAEVRGLTEAVSFWCWEKLLASGLEVKGEFWGRLSAAEASEKRVKECLIFGWRKTKTTLLLPE